MCFNVLALVLVLVLLSWYGKRALDKLERQADQQFLTVEAARL
jgi:hypothetical protein